MGGSERSANVGGRGGETIAWLVAPGLALIAVTYGLARFAYGLPSAGHARGVRPFPFLAGADRRWFLPRLLRRGHYLAGLHVEDGASPDGGWCGRGGGRGHGCVAGSPVAWVLALGILVAGSSTGLASPPMAEAVARSIRHSLQDRANTLINSGTSVGVALSGPAALLLSGQWRLAWTMFALVGLAVLAWNAAVMPREAVQDEGESGEPDEDGAEAGEGLGRTRLSFTYLIGARVRSRSLPLFAAAFGVGFASAVYWTFSREIVVQAGGLGQTGSTLFWTVIGISGLAGGAAGDLVGRLGLTSVLRGGLVSMAASMVLLADRGRTPSGLHQRSTLRFDLHHAHRRNPGMVGRCLSRETSRRARAGFLLMSP